MKDIETEFLTPTSAVRYGGHDVFGHHGSLPGYVTVHHRPSGITVALAPRHSRKLRHELESLNIEVHNMSIEKYSMEFKVNP